MTKKVQDIADADLDQVTGAGDHVDWIPVLSVDQDISRPVAKRKVKVETTWKIEEGEK